MLIYGFCNIAMIPLRKQAFHRSEMVSQLLFGEAYEIIEQETEWVYIKSLFDNYHGYIDRHQVALMRENEKIQYYQDYQPLIAQATTQLIDLRRNFTFEVPPGSSLPIGKENIIRLGAEKFEIKSISPSTSMETLMKNFINIPYLWGGRTPLGMDCSGFNQIIYKILGISLERDASLQALQGQTIEKLNNTSPGDMAFFDNKNGIITHTGLLLDQQHIIHCSGKVRIDKIDEKGIFNLEREEYSHKLHSIKRIISIA